MDLVHTGVEIAARFAPLLATKMSDLIINGFFDYGKGKILGKFEQNTILEGIKKCQEDTLSNVPGYGPDLDEYLYESQNIAILLLNPKDPLNEICPKDITDNISDEEREKLNEALSKFANCVRNKKNVKEWILPEAIFQAIFRATKDISIIRRITEENSGRATENNELLKKILEILQGLDFAKDQGSPDRINNVPRPKPGFTGRVQEIKDIREKLTEHGSVLVWGIGGIGKTEICLKYAKQHTEKEVYHNKVFVIYDGLSLRSSFAGSKGFSGIVKEEDSDDKKYNSILNFLKKNPSLVIVDNFNNEKDSYVDDLRCHPLETIFVSRNENLDMAAVHVIELEKGEPMELFKKEFFNEKVTGKDGRPRTLRDEQTVEQILEEICSHTMTIVLVARLLREYPSRTPKEVLDNLKGSSIEKIGGKVSIERIGDDKHEGDKMNGHLRKLFKMSDMSEGEKYVLMNLSIINSQTDEHLFIEMLETIDVTHDHIEESIRNLINKGWVGRIFPEDERSPTLLEVHSLISHIAIEDMKPDEKKCLAMINNTFQSIEAVEDLNPEDREKDRERLSSLLTIAEPCLTLVKDEEGMMQRTLLIANGFGKLYNNSKELSHRLNALELQKKLFGNKHPDTAESYNNIGMVYHSIVDLPRALENYNRSLGIFHELFGDKHPDTAASYNNIGVVYHSMGDLPRALENCNRSLDICRELFGDKHPNTATSYNNIGMVYHSMGDLPRALENYNRSLDIRRELFGDKHPDTATSYNNVGGVYRSMVDLPRALENLNRSLDIRRELFGDKHPAMATSYNNVGGVYQSMGDLPRALENYNRSLDIFRELFGDKHPDMATTYNNIGMMYHSMGDLPRALENYNRSLDIRRELFGKEDGRVKQLQQIIDTLKAH